MELGVVFRNLGVHVRVQVRKHVPGNPVTLAIGDGANDVDMIKQAEVRTAL